MSFPAEAVESRATIRAWGATDKGQVRRNNEDHFHIDVERGLCAVADGMGGHNAGEVAAHIAIDIVRDLIGRGGVSGPFGPAPGGSVIASLLRNAVHAANVCILEQSQAIAEHAGMGTTIVAAVVHGSRLSVAHVGDSRLYEFDGYRLHQVTMDDSWMASVLASDPQADPVALKRHPLRNALTNVVGARPEIAIHLTERSLRKDQLVLLTTDGVHGSLEPAVMEGILAKSSNASEIPGQLIAAALENGSRDNCTAVVAQFLG